MIAILIGFIGAFIGVWLAGKLALPELYTLRIGSTSFPIVWSIIGAALFVVVVGMSSAPRRRANYR